MHCQLLTGKEVNMRNERRNVLSFLTGYHRSERDPLNTEFLSVKLVYKF